MNADDFRALALELPEAIEGEHMKHPDFRVRGKIFASLWSDGRTGNVLLTPEQQASFVDADPDSFQPLNGAWGRQGGTRVVLSVASPARVRSALAAAWRNKAPATLAGQRDAPARRRRSTMLAKPTRAKSAKKKRSSGPKPTRSRRAPRRDDS